MRGLAEVSSRHGRGPLFSMGWIMFYSAHVSIRNLLSFDVFSARLHVSRVGGAVKRWDLWTSEDNRKVKCPIARLDRFGDPG